MKKRVVDVVNVAWIVAFVVLWLRSKPVYYENECRLGVTVISHWRSTNAFRPVRPAEFYVAAVTNQFMRVGFRLLSTSNAWESVR